MMGLSVRQPLATATVAGHRTVESRPWPTTHRGLVVIYAPPQYDALTGQRRAVRAAYGTGRRAVTRADVGEDSIGAYIGAVDVLGAHPADRCCEPWGVGEDEGVYHWTLDNAHAFPEPVPGRGGVGLFTIPVEALTGLVKALLHPGVRQ